MIGEWITMIDAYPDCFETTQEHNKNGFVPK